MNQRTTIGALLALLSIPAICTGQNLIALTRNTQTIHRSAHASCTPLGSCPTGLPIQTPLNYWPGGTAWDSTTSSLWVTTGLLLERHAVPACGANWGPVPCPKSSLIAEAMGMDIQDNVNELWILDDAGWVTRASNNTALTFQGAFLVPALTLAGTNAPTAIAIDELNQVVLYIKSDFGGSGSTLFVAQLSTPSVIVQTMPVSVCFAQIITGMAVHPAAGRLYMTNGRETYDYVYSVAAGPTVSLGAGVCCTNIAPFGDPYIDISIQWRAPTSTGMSCTNGTCPACANVHLLRNAPVLGTTLQIGLDFAAAGLPYWLLMNFGACNTTGPTLPPLCGPLLLPLGATLITWPFQIATGTGCNGMVTVFWLLPSNPAFLGLPFATQFVGLCPPTGTSLSNCLSWVLQ